MRVLNVGGGSKDIPLPAKYEGWEHILLDIEPGPDVDIVADARDIPNEAILFPFDAVYSAHNLEHYHAHEVPVVLRQMRRAMRPGHGEIHIIVPNLGQLMADMVQFHMDLDSVLYEIEAGPITPLDVIFGWGKEVETGNPFYAHRTGFTAARLHRVLLEAGFKDVKVVANLPSLELEATAHAPQEGNERQDRQPQHQEAEG